MMETEKAVMGQYYQSLYLSCIPIKMYLLYYGIEFLWCLTIMPAYLQFLFLKSAVLILVLH